MKKDRICRLLDKYRDGELSAAEKAGFESHLSGCAECRTAMSLLNNIVRAVKADEVRPRDLSLQIAREAIRREHSWDYEVVSWLRPGPALAALTLTVILFSSLWMITGKQQATAYAEYENLLQEADGYSRISQIQSDSELVLWLEGEGQ